MDNGKKEQLKRFKKTAKELGADTSGDALDNIIGKLDLKRKPDADKSDKPKKG